MARQLDLALISKLKHNAALYLPYAGEQKPKSAKKRYGAKLDYRHIPSQYLQSSWANKGIRSDIYHLKALHQDFAHLNIVIIVKTKLS